MAKEINLSVKEQQLREFILHESMFKVILKIGLPIAFFQGMNNILRVLDSFMAASIDATAASMVSYFGQINLIITGLGMGLAVGGSLKISNMYGNGDFSQVKKQVSSLYFFGITVCLGFILLIVPLATPILRMLNTPAEFITLGRTYFLIEFAGTMIVFLNGIYFALERVQGNTKRILRINMIAMVMRMSFTAFSVYVLQAGITFIAISTLISQMFILGVGIRNLVGKSEVFSLSLKAVSFKKEMIWPMVSVSIPIMIERSAFHVGKVIMNSMIIVFGPLYVGAAGISNLICSITVGQQMGFQDASISVKAQNLGAKQFKRVIDAFKAIMLINCIQATLFFIPFFLLARQTTGLFAIGDDYFHNILYTVHIWDIWSVLFLGAYAAVTSFLLGLGYTKLTLILNFCRVFLFRIPVLWFLQQFTNMGGAAVGFVFMFSNLAVTIVSLIMAAVCVKKYCQKHELTFWTKSKIKLT